MKLEHILWSLLIGFLVLLVVMIPYSESKRAKIIERCESQGGVVIETRSHIHCIAINAVIKL